MAKNKNIHRRFAEGITSSSHSSITIPFSVFIIISISISISICLFSILHSYLSDSIPFIFINHLSTVNSLPFNKFSIFLDSSCFQLLLHSFNLSLFLQAYNILYYTILYYTILYYTILYYTILYYTIHTPTYPPSFFPLFFDPFLYDSFLCLSFFYSIFVTILCFIFHSQLNLVFYDITVTFIIHLLLYSFVSLTVSYLSCHSNLVIVIYFLPLFSTS